MNTLKSDSLIRDSFCQRCEQATKWMQFMPVVMLLIAGSGCVHFNDTSEPASWPKPVSAADTKQFDGVYANQNIKVTNYRSGVPVTDLYDFIAGRRNGNGSRGSQVEIRASDDGSALHVRLLDGQGVEIAAIDLHGGSDFHFSNGNLTLYGPFSGNHGTQGNLGVGVQHHSAQLYVTSTHDLLGTQSETSVGFLFDFVPSVIGGTDWILWPKMTGR